MLGSGTAVTSYAASSDTPPPVHGAGARAATAAAPNTPNAPEAGPPFTKTNGVWQVNSSTPTLRNTVTATSGHKTTSTFEVHTTDSSGKPTDTVVRLTDDNEWGVLVSGEVDTGKPTSVTVPAGRLKNGVTYAVRSSGYDATSKVYENDWSPWATFKVAVPAPAKPAKPTSVVNNGKPGEFTVSLPAGHSAKWVEWQLDQAAWKRVDAAGKTSVTIDTGLRAAAASARTAGDHVLNVRTANDGGASDAVSVAFTGDGTGNGAHAVDLKLPDPNPSSPNPDQKNQTYTGKVTRPLNAPANPARVSPPRESCGPVDRHGYQACFGAPLEKLPKEIAKKAERRAAVTGRGGMVDWCANNTSGAWATRTIECETKSLPAVLRQNGEPIGTAFFDLTRELTLDGTNTFTQRVNIHPVLIPPVFRAIEMVMADQFCTGHTQCKDPGKAELDAWDGKPIWQSSTDTHDANLKTTWNWDDSQKEATYDFDTDFRLDGLLIGGNVPAPGVQTGFQWGLADPSELQEIRCDTKAQYGTSGCVFVNVAPTYTFNAAKYPQAAAHAWLLQEKLPNRMGVRTGDTPLYYLPGGTRADGKNNRDVICDEKDWANKYGDAGAMDGATDKPNCDEFAFNSTYNSGGMPKAEGGLNPVDSGSQCVQTFTKKTDGAVHLYNIDGKVPTWKEVCGRSAISGRHNSGSMAAFSGFAKNMRLMDKDPYWLETSMSGDCQDKNGTFTCTMRTS
ncbi:hypothetical protein [Streptomyces sp. NPDC005890]|uniref:hypothetical protein n=1 Tax=Streptomyces sp. NPDC005890 TaxID=3154568 RepID=UPI0033D7614C